MAVPVAVIDGPYDAAALSGVLVREPVNLGDGSCGVNPNSACDHGTFVMGLLGAHPECELLHVPLFVDQGAPQASVAELANAIMVAVKAGARLINLSLAILGDEAQDHHELAAALDHAEASGAVVVVAAGNQGRLAMGQLLWHPVTIPVVAVDATRRLLPDCNFGPLISRRGVAAFGHDVLGYAPNGKTSTMSGTSVATAVATGILAHAWVERPAADGAKIRAAVARLAPRDGLVPPMIDRGVLLAALDQIDAATVVSGLPAERGTTNYAKLQGGTTMNDGNGLPRPFNRSAGPAAMSGQTVTPQQGLGGCACGSPGGQCTCANGDASPSRFVYVLGTVDIDFPDQSVSEELQRVASDVGIPKGPNDDLRSWNHMVLNNPQARYVARQLCWSLYVEGEPIYNLELCYSDDLDELIRCLNEPKDDLCLVVGLSSPIKAEPCPGKLPILAVNYQLKRFSRQNLIGWFNPPVPPALPINPDELYVRLFHNCDNRGNEDRWRAVNYLAVRYPPLYAKFAEMAQIGYKYDYFDVVDSRLTGLGEKGKVDVIFTFKNDRGGVEDFFVRVDVRGPFPVHTSDIAEYSKKPKA